MLIEYFMLGIAYLCFRLGGKNEGATESRYEQMVRRGQDTADHLNEGQRMVMVAVVVGIAAATAALWPIDLFFLVGTYAGQKIAKFRQKK